MKSLNELLMDMNDDLFQPDEPEDETVQDDEDESGGVESPPVYQEDIPLSTAKVLLEPGEFDPECRYQLITSQFDQMVLKIDDRISPEDEIEALRKDPTTKKLHMQEYVISSMGDVSQASYPTISSELVKGPRKIPLLHRFSYLWIVLPIFLLMLGSGIALLYYVLTFNK